MKSIISLYDACCELLQRKKIIGALTIWRAILKAIELGYICDKELQYQFICKVIPEIKNYLNKNDLTRAFEVAHKFNQELATSDASNQKITEIYHLLADLKIKNSPLAGNSYELDPEISDKFEEQLTALSYYTSSLQSAEVARDEDSCQKNKEAISCLELGILQNFYIETWLAYERALKNCTYEPTSEDYIRALEWFAQVTKYCLYAIDETTYEWINYRKTLQATRNKFYESVPMLPLHSKEDIKIFFEAQEIYNKDLRDFLINLFKSCETLLGSPPCAYAILGLGSLSRKEAIIFSDFEYAIIFESIDPTRKPLIEAYFSAFIQLFLFKVQCLGESGTDNNINGLHIDDGIGLSPNYKDKQLVGSVGTIEQIFRYNTSQALAGQVYTLLHAVYLVGNTDGSCSPEGLTGSKLFKQYQSYIQYYIDTVNVDKEHAGLSSREYFTYSWLDDHRQTLENQLSQPLSLDSLIDVKERYLSPLIYLGFDLAYYYKLPISNTVDKITNTIEIWEKLNNFFDSTTVAAVKYFMATTFILRIQAQKHYGQYLKPECVALSDNTNLQKIDDSIFKKHIQKTFPDKSIIRFYTVVNELGVIDEIFKYEILLVQSLRSFLRNLSLTNLKKIKNYNPLLEHFPDILNTTITTKDPKKISKLINYLTTYLVRHDASISDYLAIYDKLSVIDNYSAEHLQLEFIAQLKLINNGLTSDQLTKNIKRLMARPNPDGWRAGSYYHQRDFYEQAKQLFDPISEEKAKEAMQVGLTVISTHDLNMQDRTVVRYYLFKSDIERQFINKGALKPRDRNQQSGNHTVYVIETESTTFCLKMLPEQPGTVSMISELDLRVVGGSTLPILTIKMNIGNESMCFQLFPYVKGLKLDDGDRAQSVRTHPEELKKLNYVSFFQNLFIVLLTNPGDEKAEDCFFVESKFREGEFDLIRIDLERALYEIEEATKKLLRITKSLQVKSVTLCLDQVMKKLPWEDPQFFALVEDMLSLEPKELLKSWLRDLHEEHAFYKNLFSEEEVKKHFSLTKPGSSTLTVIVAEGLVSELLIRIELLLTSLRKYRKEFLLTKKSTKSAKDLIRAVLPVLFDKYYAKVFDTDPVTENEPGRFFKRYTNLMGQNIIKSLRNSSVIVVISKSLGVKRSIDINEVLAIYNSDQDSPTQGLNELAGKHSTRTEAILNALIGGNATGVVELTQVSDRQKILIIQEFFRAYQEELTVDKKQKLKKILNSLLEIMCDLDFTKLNVSAFGKLLTDSYFIRILSRTGINLRHLMINDNQSITQQSIDKILREKLLSNLETFNIHHQENITEIGNEDKALHLVNLQHLELRRLPELTHINLTAMFLETLIVEDAVNLTSLMIYAPNLKKLVIRLTGLQKVILNCQYLESVQIQACNELQEFKTSSARLKILLIEGCKLLPWYALKNCCESASQLVDLQLPDMSIPESFNNFLFKYPFFIRFVSLNQLTQVFVIKAAILCERYNVKNLRQIIKLESLLENYIKKIQLLETVYNTLQTLFDNSSLYEVLYHFEIEKVIAAYFAILANQPIVEQYRTNMADNSVDKKSFIINNKKQVRYSAEAGERQHYIETLQSQLDNNHPDICINAIQELDLLGINTSISVYIKLLVSQNDEICQTALTALQNLAVDEHNKCLIIYNFTRFRVDKEIGRVQAIKALVVRLAVLDTDNPFKQRLSSSLLIQLGREAVAVGVDILLSWLPNNDEAYWQIRIIYALTMLGEKAATKEVFNTLLLHLKHRETKVRSAAINAIAVFAKQAVIEEVMPVLLLGLEDDSPTIRADTAKAINAFGNLAITDTIIKALLKSFTQDRCDEVSIAAVETLSELGDNVITRKFIDAMLDQLNNKIRKVALKKTIIRILDMMEDKVTNEKVLKNIFDLLLTKSEIAIEAELLSIICKLTVKLFKNLFDITQIKKDFELIFGSSITHLNQSMSSQLIKSPPANTNTGVVASLGRLLQQVNNVHSVDSDNNSDGSIALSQDHCH